MQLMTLELFLALSLVAVVALGVDLVRDFREGRWK